MLHSAILSTFIKLPFVIKNFVLSIFEWPFYAGFTVYTLTWRPGISYKGLSYLLGLCDYKLSNEEMMFSRLQMIHKTYDPSWEDIIIFK